MDIKCKECGSNINLDQSLRDEILNHEIQKHDQVTQTKHQKEIKEMQRVHEESIKSKEVTIEENFKNKVQLLEERNNSLKEHELNLERKNLQLKDEIKDATIAAEKDSRELFKQKEAELEKKNIKVLDAQQKDAELEIKELKNSLRLESESAIRERDLEVQRLRKEAEDARAKLNHAKSSQELVGEAAELLLLERLQTNFEFDSFEEIKKGQQGADIFQSVCTRTGKVAGSIYYESKKTKHWSEGWISKFKDDIRKKGATIGILVTEVLPDYCNDIIFKDGIWITSPRFVLFVAAACSKEIHSVHKAKIVKAGKASLEGDVYDYITGDEFIGRFRVVTETIAAQLDDLEREEKALRKTWRVRRKQIDKSQTNLVEIFGDLDALSNGNIKSIEDFQLKLD